MKIIITVVLLAILSACSQSNVERNEKIKKISIHTFSAGDGDDNRAYWYYIRNRNAHGDKGYYLQSQKPLENFAKANFVYYDSKPDKFREAYPLKEKIILINAKDLPINVQQSISDLESISVRE